MTWLSVGFAEEALALLLLLFCFCFLFLSSFVVVLFCICLLVCSIQSYSNVPCTELALLFGGKASDRNLSFSVCTFCIFCSSSLDCYTMRK